MSSQQPIIQHGSLVLSIDEAAELERCLSSLDPKSSSYRALSTVTQAASLQIQRKRSVEANYRAAAHLQKLGPKLKGIRVNSARARSASSYSRRHNAIFTERQLSQLLTQIQAFSELDSSRALSETTRTALASFYTDRPPDAYKAAATPPRTDPLALLTAVRANTIHRGLNTSSVMDPRVLSAELSHVTASQMAERRKHVTRGLEHILRTHYSHAGKRKLPDFLDELGESEAASNVLARKVAETVSPALGALPHMLQLSTVQRDVRRAVVDSMPAATLARGRFRKDRVLGRKERQREKKRKKAKRQRDREHARTRKRFLSAVTSHATKFKRWHRENARTVRKVATAAAKVISDRERTNVNEERQMERERIKALKAHNHEKYVSMLKQVKNERLLKIFRQTEEYMNKLGATIVQGREGVSSSPSSSSSSSSSSTSSLPNASSKQRYYELAHAVQEDVQQPSLLVGGDLRSYQMQGLRWLVSLNNNKLNGILADEMGLGKTIQTIALIAHLMEVKGNQGPFLFIVPMSTLHNNWETEFDKWLPSAVKVVYDGHKDARKKLRKRLAAKDYNCVLTTYEFAMRDRRYLNKIPWEYIVVDEAHRLKNPRCRLARDLATYHQGARRVALTGTPLQNELHELWSLLNFLVPHIFNNASTFHDWFARPFESMGAGGSTTAGEEAAAMTEEEQLLIIDRLHSIVRPFMLRREKTEVATELPENVEHVLRVHMTPVQDAMYRAIKSKRVRTHNPGMQLRKVANHPYLFHPYMRGNVNGALKWPLNEELVELSGKVKLCDQILTKLKASGHRCLIFSQMTRMLELLVDLCHLRGHRVLRLDGTTAAADREDSVRKFNAPDSPYFVFLLSTKAGGLGLNLQAADTVIIFDSDWNPQNDQQAKARSHRIGQKKQVITIRLVTVGTVEERMLLTANAKLRQEQAAIQAGQFHSRYNMEEAHEMVGRVLREQFDTSDDVVDADAVSRAVARSDQELELFKQMDARMFLEAKRRARLLRGDEADDDDDDDDDVIVSKYHRFMPRWVDDFLMSGTKSVVSETDLIPIEHTRSSSQAGAQAAAAAAQAKAMLQANAGRGARRGSRKQVSYAPQTDAAFERMLRRIEDHGPDEDEEDDDDDEDDEEEEDIEARAPSPIPSSGTVTPSLTPAPFDVEHEADDADPQPKRVKLDPSAVPAVQLGGSSGAFKFTLKRRKVAE